MITSFFTSSYVWSPFWVHKIFLEKQWQGDRTVCGHSPEKKKGLRKIWPKNYFLNDRNILYLPLFLFMLPFGVSIYIYIYIWHKWKEFHCEKEQRTQPRGTTHNNQRAPTNKKPFDKKFPSKRRLMYTPYESIWPAS
jgi:hypothetical protein